MGMQRLGSLFSGEVYGHNVDITLSCCANSLLCRDVPLFYFFELWLSLNHLLSRGGRSGSYCPLSLESVEMLPISSGSHINQGSLNRTELKEYIY